MTKRVLITGITGQDGSYMAEYCLDLGHEVYGLVRRTSQIQDKNFKHLYANPKFHIVRGDLQDGGSLDHLVQEIKPDYFINFAAQSFVGDSWKIPEETFLAGAVGVLKCLEAVRKYVPNCRFYNAGSSEQFGDVAYQPQDEKHPFRPRSPYGAAKCAAHHLVKVYRESYGLYAIQGLLFNHESERRGEEFVTRKITKGIARIVKSIQNKEKFEPVRLGNIYALRDWSHSKDFVDGIWRMLNQDHYNPEALNWGKIQNPETLEWSQCRGQILEQKELSLNIKEYVLASGETHSVKEFAEIVAKEAGLDFVWVGEGEQEKMIFPDYIRDVSHLESQILIEIDPKYYRPAEVNLLLGDASEAKKDLGWAPKISFDKLAKLMIQSDLYESGIRPQVAAESGQAQSPQ